MSTNSNIIVKVKKSEINCLMLFDAKKLDAPEEYWGKGATNKKGVEQAVDITKDYIGIYCHWDGFLDEVGRVLKEHFNTYEKALNLVLGGSCSSLGDKGDIIRFATRGGEKWNNIEPRQSDNPISLAKQEYNYLFEDGKWKWLDKGVWKEY